MRDLIEMFEHWQAGDSLRFMERNLGMDRHTLRKYLAVAEGDGLTRETPMTADDWRIWIRDHLSGSWGSSGVASATLFAPYREQIERGLQTNHVTTVWQRWCQETGITVSLSTFRRYCRTLTVPPQPRDVTVWRPEVGPGEEAQVDFGKMGRWTDPLTHRTVTMWAFVMTLAYSRHQFVYWTVKQDLAVWTTAHVRAFAFFGGVPKRIVLDNLKDGVIKPDLYDPQLNRTYRDLATHYGFLVDPGRVAHPKDKPRVERQMPYIRDSAWVGQDWPDLAAAQSGVERWAREVAGRRIHGTTGHAPWELFTTNEQPALQPLPVTPWEFGTWQTAKIGPDSHAMVHRTLYSVPWRYLGQTLDVWVSTSRVVFYVGTERVKSHPVGLARQRVTDVQDLPPDALAFYQKTAAWCRHEATRLGPHIEVVITDLLQENTALHLRSAQGVLRLAERYGAERLNAACQRARFFGDMRYQTVKGILLKALDTEPLPDTPVGQQVLSHTHLRGPNAFRT